MKWNMVSWRVWLFRGLVTVAVGLMVASFIGPWWIADVIPGDVNIAPHFTIGVYQYGIPRGPGSEYIATDITPFYQVVLAWIYTAVSVGLMIYSTWLRGRRGRWLLGGIGLIYIAYATIAAIWIANRTGDFGISFHGISFIPGQAGGLDVYTGLQVEYYLAHACGLTCIALALLRNKIVGKPRVGA